MNQKIKFTFCFLLLGGLIVTIFICATLPQKAQWNNEKDFIVNTYPLLSDATACSWKSGTINGGRGVGPSSTWIKAFVKVDLDEIRGKYAWKSVDKLPAKIEKCPLFDGSPRNWVMSADLNADLFSPQYVGEAFVDFDNSLVFFYSETV